MEKRPIVVDWYPKLQLIKVETGRKPKRKLTRIQENYLKSILRLLILMNLF